MLSISNSVWKKLSNNKHQIEILRKNYIRALKCALSLQNSFNSKTVQPKMHRLYTFWQILCWASLTLINNIITLHDTEYGNKIDVEINGIGICNIHSFYFRGSLIEKSYVFEADNFVGSVCNFTMVSRSSNDYIAFHLNDRVSSRELLKLYGVRQTINIDQTYKTDTCFGFNSEVSVRYTNSRVEGSQMKFTVMWGTRFACLPGTIELE
ncbi:hypothetical protein GJ496_008293 [Pomphorhynchus laevis]|nr:hypothetical protein GJ496_008293 [Pomphorhynchus laevis]